MKIRAVVLLFAMAVLTLGASIASAQTFTSTLNAGNSAISGFAGPYGTVGVTLSGQTATITFTAGTNVLFGDSSSVDVNINSTSFTDAFVSATGPGTTGFNNPTFVSFGSGQVDGFGTFNLTTDLFDGFTDAATTVIFTVTNTSTTAWGSASDVLTNNANGDDAAAHIFVCGTNGTGSTQGACVAGNGATATGFAGEGAPAVPEPASMLLFGAGMVYLGRNLRRRNKGTVAA